jgi:hypothetical protein
MQTTYLDIATTFGGDEGLSTSYLAGLDLPIVDIQEEQHPIGGTRLTGKFEHPASEPWFHFLPLYRSANTGTSLSVCL